MKILCAMLSNKWVLIFPLLLTINVCGICQSALNTCYGFDCREKKMSFSFFAGFPLLGPGKDIERGMVVSGLGDIRPASDGWFGNGKAKDYPKRHVGPSWNFELRRNVTNRSGYQINAGLISSSYIQGYDSAGLGNDFKIRSRVQAVSLNHVWRTGKGMSGFNIGPTMARHVIRDEQPYYDEIRSTNIKLGVNLGYTLAIVQKKSWFLTVKTNYTWLPDAEIGPYTKGTDFDESTFEETNVRLSSFNLGVSTGWRF